MNAPQHEPFLCMAPLKGFTDCVFRTIYAAHFQGFDLALAPFIASKRDRILKKKYVKDVLPERNPRLPVVPQILSKDAGDFVHLANYLHELGYGTVNWNLGCPYPTVANKKRGAGMLPHTDMIHEFLDYALPRLDGALSIKTRLGWRTPDDLIRLIPILNQYPLAEVIVHPRTGIQRYEGDVNLEVFHRCAGMLRHEIVYNGDIRTLDDYRRLARRFPAVQRWMIGRGCLADPFLPQAIKTGQKGVADRIRRMRDFHAALFAAYQRTLEGPGHVMNKMKGLWCYFSQPFEDCAKNVKKIKRARQPEHYLELANRFFDAEAERFRTFEKNAEFKDGGLSG